MAECPFCAAASGKLDAVEVWSSPEVFAFLDHRPVFKGHVLVLPRAHVVVLADLAADEVGAGLGAGGTFVALNNRVSQSVPHLHTHVVPRTKGDGLRGFFWPRTKYESPEEAAEYAAKIAGAM